MPVEIHATPSYVLATIREDLKSSQLAEILSCFKEAESRVGVKTIILDMVGVGHCDEMALQDLVKAAQVLRDKEIRVYVVRLSQFMQMKVTRGGLGQVLVYRESVDHALTEAGIDTKNNHKLDTDFIKTILDGILQVVSDKSKLQLKPGPIFTKMKDDTFKGDVFTILGIVSSTFNGSIAIAFSAALFAHITTSIAGEIAPTDGSQDTDTGNALLSLISKKSEEGLLKKKLAAQQFIPLVIRGESLEITEIIPDPLLIFPFATDKGALQIYVGLNSD